MTADFSGEAYVARRALYRELMSAHAGEIPWLLDPSAIPPNAVSYDSDYVPSPYHSLGKWMLDRLVDWSDNAHEELDFTRVFAKHNVPAEGQLATRERISKYARTAFMPGIITLAQIHEVVPAVATRDDLDRTIWPAVSSQAQEFGAGLAHNGTLVMRIVRRYLDKSPDYPFGQMDPAKLRMDNVTGINTVVPLDRLIRAAQNAIERYIPSGHPQNTCIAMYAPIPELGGASMFSASWRAYGETAQRLLYHYENIDQDSITSVINETDPEKIINRTTQIVAYENEGAVVIPDGDGLLILRDNRLTWRPIVP